MSDEILKGVDSSPSGLAGAFACHDDLKVVGRILSDQDAFTLTSVIRNEMYFLPAFLDHYRALGVERFVFVDDQSTDGSREYLCDQTDCMVLKSGMHFNDKVRFDLPGVGREGMVRVRNVWANLLLMRYGMQRWSLHVDADEFLRIPAEMKFRDLVGDIDPEAGHAVWGVMIDLYPAGMKELQMQAEDDRLDPNGEWYFDARRHARLRDDGRLKFMYIGSRARLMDRYGVRRLGFFKRLHSYFKTVSYNFLQKPPLMCMPAGGFLRDTHRPSFRSVPDLILPLEHFKFSGQLFSRTEAAIKRNSHYSNSVEYRDMERLLGAMAESEGSFLAKCSSADRSFENYRRVGIAQGLT